jgi:hypothetical protein
MSVNLSIRTIVSREMKIKSRIAPWISTAALLLTLLPWQAQAAPLSNRSLTLGSSAITTSTTHKFDFTVPTGGNVGSIQFLYCTTTVGSCTKPAGLTTTSATLTAQSGATGFTIDNTTDGAPFITRASTNIPATTVVSYTLGAVLNPSTTNQTFYVRISTYVSIDTTGGSTDAGVVAASTATQVTITGVMPESLVFCVGTTWNTGCGDISGNSLDLGTFSPSTASFGTSVMSASTNAGFGYAITVNGTTMTSGSNTIAAMGTQSQNSSGCSPTCTSTPGTAQFGTNVRDNTSPNVGANVSGAGSGTGFSGYNSIDSFRFFSGDTVASASGPTDANLFTNSYVVNVGGSQAAGTYTATMTYICTATF